VMGQDIQKGNNTRIKQKIGYLPEESPLYEAMTAEQYLLFFSELLKYGLALAAFLVALRSGWSVEQAMMAQLIMMALCHVAYFSLVTRTFVDFDLVRRRFRQMIGSEPAQEIDPRARRIQVDIRDQQVERIVVNLHQGGIGILHRHELPIRGFEELLEELARFGVVVDQEDARHAQEGIAGELPAGRSMTKAAPVDCVDNVD